MDYLLDTHTCIWTIGRQAKLSLTVKNILANPKNNFWVSKISLPEIAIKLKIGKLDNFETSLPDFIEALTLSGYSMLPIKDEHLETYTQFEFEDTHRDPFDRYLIATTLYENFTIITKDEKFQLYAERCKILW